MVSRSWSQRAALVAATLMVVGRDGILASNAQVPSSGSIGGEALYTRCGGRLVSGLYSRPTLPLGYSLITTVPAGACRINISELVHSDNYLALKLTNSTFIINGDFAVSSPGQYDAAGTRFTYKRGAGLSEAIWASGPIDHAVDILILYQHPNPNIAYEYQISIPPDDQYAKSSSSNAVIAPPLLLPRVSEPSQLPRHKHRQHQHARRFGDAPPILAISNPPPPSNSYTSIATGPNLTQAIVRSEVPQAPYVTTRMLNTESVRTQFNGSSNGRPSRKRKFIWKVNGYTPCSRTCVGGVQTTIVQCVREYNHAPVPERRCLLTRPRPLTRVCGNGPCSPRWQAGSWSACPECGPASRHRLLACVQENGSGITKLPIDHCTPEPPPESEKCDIPNCLPTSSTGAEEVDTNRITPIPLDPGSDKQKGLESPWVKPHRPETDTFRDSTTNVIMTRYRNDTHYNDRKRNDDVSNDIDNIDNARNHYGIISTIDTSNNNNNNNQRGNNIDVNTGSGWQSGGVWMSAEWSEQCTSSCGRGVQTRALLCTEPNSCDSSRRPTSARYCASERGCSLQPATWFTGPWSPCSRACGGSAAVMTRELACLSSVHGVMHVDGTGGACSRLARPETTRPCSPAKPNCPPEWYLSEWSQCSGPCGSSFQTRTVWCSMEDGPQGPLPDNLCKDPKPYHKRTCIPAHCGGTYQGTGETNSIGKVSSDDNNGSRECADNFSSCGLAVQARLCQYRYYATSCCLSCQRAGALPSVVT